MQRYEKFYLDRIYILYVASMMTHWGISHLHLHLQTYFLNEKFSVLVIFSRFWEHPCTELLWYIFPSSSFPLKYFKGTSICVIYPISFFLLQNWTSLSFGPKLPFLQRFLPAVDELYVSPKKYSQKWDSLTLTLHHP